MDTLRKQVRRARRRLTLQRFLVLVAWTWSASFAAAAVAIALPKIWNLPALGPLWAAGWAGGAVVAGLAAALAWTWATRRSTLEAAIEIDRRFGLKERVSSALALEESERETQAGQALLDDAVRHVERIEVQERFQLALGRRALLPLLPAAAVFLLVMFVGDKASQNEAQATTEAAAVKKQIQESTRPLQRKVAQREKEAREKGLDDAANLFKKVEQGTHNLAHKDDLDREKALVKLNDLAKELADRRQRLGGEDKIKQQLQNLKNASSGPAEKLAGTLKDGDFKKAIQELDKLKQQLAKGDLDEHQKTEMAKQLADMQNKLNQAAQAHEEAQKQLQRQIEQLQQSGQTAQAQKLQEQLDKLQQQNQQMNKLQELASKLGQAADGMKNGKQSQASAALDQLKSELSQLKQEQAEAQMLDSTLQEIAQAKQTMNCDQCHGAGCKACQGDAMTMDGMDGNGDKPGGQGLGQGRGEGDRPEEKNKTATRDTSVRQKVGPGGAVVTGEADGPNIKGNVQQRIQETVAGGRQKVEDPLSREPLPRQQRDHVKEYFDTLREGG